MTVYGVAAWLLLHYPLIVLPLPVLSAFLMVVLNNRNALIRIYSRMVSCSFIALSVMTLPLTAHDGEMLPFCAVQLCFIVFYLILFATYQNRRSQALVFYAFLSVGIASLFFVQILFFVPFMWILMGRNMMAMSMRIFTASLLGLILPYWFAAGWYAFSGDISPLLRHIAGITDIFIPEAIRLFMDGTGLTHFGQATETWHAMVLDVRTVRMLPTFVFMLAVSVIGMVHFIRYSYQDKIRTRMIFETVMTLTVLIIVFVILQPQHTVMLLALMTVNTGVLAAHFIALTSSRAANATFVTLTVLTLALTAFNIYGSSC